MSKSIFIGGFPSQTTEEEINALFSPHGTIERTKVINQPGRSPFGFIEMSDEEATAAMEALNQGEGTSLHGSKLTINEARPRN